MMKTTTLQRKHLWLAALAAAILLVFLFARDDEQEDAAYSVYTVKKIPVEISLQERGILQCRNSTPVEVGASGEIIEILKSGTPVRKGQRLLLTDDSDLRERLEEQEVEFKTLESDIDVNRAEYALAEVQEKNRLALLKAQHNLAALDEEIARAGLSESSQRLLEIERIAARLRMEDARDELDREKRLHAKKFVSYAMVERYERKAKSAKVAFEEAELKIRLRKKETPPEELLEKTQRTALLKAQLNRSARAMRRRLALVQHRIDLNLVQLERKRIYLDSIREEIGAAGVVADIDGIMSVRLYRDWRSGGQWMEYKPGIRKRQHDHVADIVNLGKMNVFVMIHESDINRVKPGLPAKIRLPAYPTREFTGTLVELGGVGRDRFDVAPQGQEADKTGVTTFNAMVELNTDTAEFRPGMSGIVKIIIEDATPRLVVPIEAVIEQDDGFRVRRKGALRTKDVQVTGRVFNEQYFLITSGLDEGDDILIETQVKGPTPL